MGETLANHSYVNLSLVGRAIDSSDSVVCHTDLATCCSGGQGIRLGGWYFLDYEARGAQIVSIRRTTATGPTGIYRCDIATTMMILTSQ